MANWKTFGSKEKRVWAASILFVVIIAYGYGLITVKYHIFPYRQLRSIKHIVIPGNKKNPRAEHGLIAGKPKHPKLYYLEKKSFFEINGKKADIVMIGDSITDHADWDELFPNISIVNRGISGDTTEGVLLRMASIYSANAKKAFIMIGINDLSKKIPISKILSNYEGIVVRLKQHGILPYIESVLPVGNTHAYLNENVVKLNSKLKELSKKENVVFIDLDKVFAQNGMLNPIYSSKDDIHLNGEGYFVWKNSIKKFIE